MTLKAASAVSRTRKYLPRWIRDVGQMIILSFRPVGFTDNGEKLSHALGESRACVEGVDRRKRFISLFLLFTFGASVTIRASPGEPVAADRYGQQVVDIF